MIKDIAFYSLDILLWTVFFTIALHNNLDPAGGGIIIHGAPIAALVIAVIFSCVGVLIDFLRITTLFMKDGKKKEKRIDFIIGTKTLLFIIAIPVIAYSAFIDYLKYLDYSSAGYELLTKWSFEALSKNLLSLSILIILFLMLALKEKPELLSPRFYIELLKNIIKN